MGFEADVSDPQSAISLIDEIISRFNQHDVLVNTVGGYAALALDNSDLLCFDV